MGAFFHSLQHSLQPCSSTQRYPLKSNYGCFLPFPTPIHNATTLRTRQCTTWSKDPKGPVQCLCTHFSLVVLLPKHRTARQVVIKSRKSECRTTGIVETEWDGLQIKCFTYKRKIEGQFPSQNIINAIVLPYLPIGLSISLPPLVASVDSVKKPSLVYFSVQEALEIRAGLDYFEALGETFEGVRTMRDKFGLLSSWGSQEEDCCKWRGIRCSNTTAHVILLDLHGWIDYAIRTAFFLSGKVSPSLLELNQLKYLDLSYNDFQSSPIPEFIGSLSKLQHLNLSWSGFVGRVPHQLGNLTNLRALDLGFNFDILTVENLEWLSDLRLLRHLDLNTIDLEKVDLLQSIERLSFLSSLHLDVCNLPGIISPSLHLTNFSSIPLSIIHLSDNHFSKSSSYNWLFNFSSSLVDVHMSSNPLGGSIPEVFGNMMSLESLNLYQCGLEGEIPKSFVNLSRLKALDLSYNNLTGQLPELFHKLFASKNSLEILRLTLNKVSGSLPDFTSFSSLRHLKLRRNKLSGPFPKRFGQSSSLEDLDLSANELNGSLPELTLFLLLRYLYLSKNSLKVGPESIRKLSKLKSLDLSF
ncbi:hypothetical protein LguiB_027355 [Lonicera macranthoides]